MTFISRLFAERFRGVPASAIIGLLGIVLGTLSYGDFFSRGGYADDFFFLTRAHEGNFLEVISNWGDSRLTQAAATAIFFKLIAWSDQIFVNWWIIHGFGVIALFLTAYYFFKTLAAISVPTTIKYLAPLIFLLHPIKTEALFWPCSTITYVLAGLLVSVASWLLFSEAAQNKFTLQRFVWVFLFIVIASLAVEQVLPLAIGILALRLMVFPSNFREKFYIILTGILWIIIFLLSLTLRNSGSTVSRVKQHPLPFESIPANTFNTAVESLAELALSPIKYIADRYYLQDILSEVFSVAFILGIVGIAALASTLSKLATSPVESNTGNSKSAWFLLATGVILWLMAFSPLFVIKYYLPWRIYYLPLFGASLAIAASAHLTIVAAKRLVNPFIPMALIVFVLLAPSLLTNRYIQADYARAWAIEKPLIEIFATHSQEFAGLNKLFVFNIPEPYGPSQQFLKPISFQGINKVTGGNKKLVLMDRPEATDFDAIVTQSANAERAWSLVYSKDQQGFDLYQGLTQNHENKLASIQSMPSAGLPIKLGFVPFPLNGAIQENDTKWTVNLMGLRNKKYDFALIRATFTMPASLASDRIKRGLRAIYRGGLEIPHDLPPVKPEAHSNQGLPSAMIQISDVFVVQNISKVQSVRPSLNGQNLPNSPDIPLPKFPDSE